MRGPLVRDTGDSRPACRLALTPCRGHAGLDPWASAVVDVAEEPRHACAHDHFVAQLYEGRDPEELRSRRVRTASPPPHRHTTPTLACKSAGTQGRLVVAGGARAPERSGDAGGA